MIAGNNSTVSTYSTRSSSRAAKIAYVYGSNLIVVSSSYEVFKIPLS